MGSAVFSSSYSTSIAGYATYNVRITYSESYNTSTNKSIISITGVELQKEDNTVNWGSLAFFGSVTVNGTTLLTMDGGSSVRVSLSGSGYCSVAIPSSSSVEVAHNNDGTGSFTLGVVGGFSFEGDSMFCALYQSTPFGVKTASKTVTLTSRGHTLTTTVSPSGYGTVTSGATLANGKTKSLTATPAATTAQYTYAFSSWSVSGTGAKVSSSTANPTTFTMGTANATVTANFTRSTRSYTVSCQDRVGSASGTLLGTKTASYTYGSSVSGASFGSSTSYDAYYTGYHYTGSSSTITVDGNETVYRYFALNTWTISYNANNGTGAPSAQTKTYGVNLTLSSTKPTRANSSAGSYTVTYNANGGTVSPSSASAARTTSYTFSSWNTAANGSGTRYSSGGTYSANSAATLYAQWSSTTTTASVTLPTPTRTGYNFKGWATSSSASTGVTGNYTPTKDITLYAIWELKSYTLSISRGNGTTITVKRNGTSLSDGATIYHFDVLSISISANTGYTIQTHTVNNTTWDSGNYTVGGNVSVVATATLISYILSLSYSSNGVSISVNRTSSPIGSGSIGALKNGDKLYYNDVIEINYTISGAYQLLTATVNNIDISTASLPYNLTVKSNVVISVTAKLGAIVYIGNEAYQAFIGTLVNGNAVWQQYQAFIGNGSTYDQY